MDDIAVVVRQSRRLERLLKEHYHAQGRGLHELVTSCQERLPHDVIAKLRFVATIRNKTVHEDGYEVDDMRGFVSACKQCEKELQPRSNRMIWRVALFLIFAVTVGAVWFYIENWRHIIGT
ncbi:DUF4145 domain-containing protein [Enterovibrio norvegicus FF-33]|uniref:hypothetical protein n=1 Tax=Enterovibrio norvegicus TaxID=188144 RepID=UPI0002D9EDEF|nr:hypothetical protein [Enterovibrio norvegicus]OEE68721.1 DUF4145 domain-containing protein [Enterovibrio norvegicus FF-33]